MVKGCYIFIRRSYIWIYSHLHQLTGLNRNSAVIMASFGLNMLLKYGWEEGKGLGRNETGLTAPIKPKLKFDKVGLGMDKSEEFTFHWWDHAYNKAAQNLNVVQRNCGKIEINKKKEFKIATKKPTAISKQKSAYGNFVKGNVLSGGQEISTKDDSSDSEEDLDRKDLTSTLTDNQLFELCGGLTAHKGARHGFNMTAKLSRIEKQEKAVIEKTGLSFQSFLPNIQNKFERTWHNVENTVPSVQDKVESTLPSVNSNGETNNLSNVQDKVIEFNSLNVQNEDSSVQNNVKSILKVKKFHNANNRKVGKLVHFKKEILVKLFSKSCSAFVMEVKKLKKKKHKREPIDLAASQVVTYTQGSLGPTEDALHNISSLISNDFCVNKKKSKKKKLKIEPIDLTASQVDTSTKGLPEGVSSNISLCYNNDCDNFNLELDSVPSKKKKKKKKGIKNQPIESVSLDTKLLQEEIPGLPLSEGLLHEDITGLPLSEGEEIVVVKKKRKHKEKKAVLVEAAHGVSDDVVKELTIDADSSNNNNGQNVETFTEEIKKSVLKTIKLDALENKGNCVEENVFQLSPETFVNLKKKKSKKRKRTDDSECESSVDLLPNTNELEAIAPKKKKKL